MPQQYYARRQQKKSTPTHTQTTRRHRPPITASPRKLHPVQVALLWCAVLLGIYCTILGLTRITTPHVITIPSRVATQKDLLKKDIDAIIAAHDYHIGVSVTDTDSSDSVNLGDQQQFIAASTGKLLTALCYYHEVENGRLSLNQQIGAWPASFQLKEMMTISDNDSWSQLEHAIGLDKLNRYAQSLGVKNYDANTNMITPGELTKILSAFYAGRLINAAHTQALLGYMQQTNMEQMIPAVTPSSLQVYHKYGLYAGTLHDAGIISDGTHSYALAIYTQNVDDSDDVERIEVVRDITRVIIKHLFDGVTPPNPAPAVSVEA